MRFGDCVVCSEPVKGRKRMSATTCAGRCERTRASQRNAALLRGETLHAPKPPVPSRSVQNRRQKLKLHGIDGATALEFSENKIGNCNVCGELAALEVEHDHGHCPGRYGCAECVRGFTCGDCNKAIAFLRDSPERARRLAAYLAEAAGERYAP